MSKRLGLKALVLDLSAGVSTFPRDQFLGSVTKEIWLSTNHDRILLDSTGSLLFLYREGDLTKMVKFP